MLDSERDQYLNNIKYKLKFSDFIDVFSPEEILEWRTHASLGLLVLFIHFHFILERKYN
jgi:hypothetical protein